MRMSRELCETGGGLGRLPKYQKIEFKTPHHLVCLTICYCSLVKALAYVLTHKLGGRDTKCRSANLFILRLYNG